MRRWLTGFILAASGPITSAPPGFQTFRSFVLRVQDVGDPGDGQDRIGVSFLLTPPPPPPACAAFVPLTFPILEGNIIVEDAVS